MAKEDTMDLLHYLYETLGMDIGALLLQRKEDDSQLNRRSLVRSTFAFIEGLIFHLKLYVLDIAAKKGVEFTAAERALLTEESYELNGQGDVQIRKRHLQLLRRIRFTFKMFAKCYGISDPLKVDDAGWASFQQALKVRDRLTHPNEVGDLNVSEDDIERTINATQWFSHNLVSAFRTVLEGNEANLLRMEERFEEKLK